MDMNEMERIIKNAKANLAIEGLNVTEDEVENGWRLLRGEVTADELVKQYIQQLMAANG